MDQGKHHQNKKSLTQLLMNAQFLKRVITKLLLSLPLFSLLFFHSTWLYERLINFNSFSSLPIKLFSSLPIKLVSHTLDKNYIFLLCNLLVLLARYSGLLNSSSSSSSSKHDNSTLNEYDTYKRFQDYSRPEMVEMTEQDHQMPLLGKEEDVSDHQSSNTQNEHEHIEQVITIDEHEGTIDHDHQKMFMVEEDHRQQGDQEEEEDEEKQAFVEELEEEEEEEDEEKQAFVEELEEEEEDFNEEQAGWMFWEKVEEKEDEERGGNGRLSTEELNRKFDEFIRKMKEELRIEAQRQLVMV